MTSNGINGIVKMKETLGRKVGTMSKNFQVSSCPYCGGALEKGALRSRGGVFFLPENSKVPAFYTEGAMRKASAIPFPPFPLEMQICFPDAYVCRTCRMVVMAYQEEW